MKINLLYSVIMAFLAIIAVTSCTKPDVLSDADHLSEHTQLDYQKAIIGSWQVSHKGIEVAMHDGHICTDPANMPADKITYEVLWESVTSNEKKNFKENGDYLYYVKPTLTCQGNYTISVIGLLEMKTNCENTIEKIESLTKTTLIARQGNNFVKYQKLD